ncbi:hypothetical protein [Nocardiopsis ganjiahuensis]|uniref:hypothetical protein n=1 Tax=Nocardiopsis ganjiahuensis TaxID=239984 RepID=UPI00036FDB52|nr:hypothetical protein [Nocardiopsis ganjiahuensis]
MIPQNLLTAGHRSGRTHAAGVGGGERLERGASGRHVGGDGAARTANRPRQ